MDAIVTGSFDPMTIGHCELVRLASKKFDKVYVVALVNADKKHMFSLEQRKQIIELSVGDIENEENDLKTGRFCYVNFRNLPCRPLQMRLLFCKCLS